MFYTLVHAMAVYGIISLFNEAIKDRKQAKQAGANARIVLLPPLLLAIPYSLVAGGYLLAYVTSLGHSIVSLGHSMLWLGVLAFPFSLFLFLIKAVSDWRQRFPRNDEGEDEA